MTNQPWKFIGFMTDNSEAIKRLLLPFHILNPEKREYRIEEFGIFNKNLYEEIDRLTSLLKSEKMEQTNWEEKRVDLGYMVLCSHCNEQLCGCPQRESDGSWMMQEELKSFISSLLKSEREAGYKAGRESAVQKIESYFRGLIHIPFPEKTKENLINLINKDEK